MDASPMEPCGIARSLGVLGERWTFLVVREATKERRDPDFRQH